jgi:hypothetical protein
MDTIKRNLLASSALVILGVLLAVLVLSAIPQGNSEDHTHPHDEAHWTWNLPGFLTVDDSDANSTSYCPKRDYWRNGNFFDYRFSYVRGNTHYHRYVKHHSGGGISTVDRACALV